MGSIAIFDMRCRDQSQFGIATIHEEECLSDVLALNEPGL